MTQDVVLIGLVAFVTASLLIWILEPVAGRIGLVDHPGGRKAHAHPTPLIGGIGMFVALAFAVLSYAVSLSSYRMLFAGALLLVVVGVLDDLRELSARHRFAAQITASLLMALGAGVQLHDFGYLISPAFTLSLGILAVPLTLFATVGVINAVNMTDGIDGLAASLVLIAVIGFALIAWTQGESAPLGVLVALAAVLVAFLMFNLRFGGKALVFMGDAGSMFLGFVVAWFLIKFSQGEERLLAPVTALWLFAMPLIDTVSMMTRRMMLGRSPFQADREHFHHILMAAGYSPKQTLGLILLLALLAAGIGLAGHFYGVAEHWMFLGFLGVFAAHFSMIMRAWRVKRLFARPLLHKVGSGS
jgi:UDP-GlcNAc:undecaprenyl-phosphate GlcNAc-1-phosphate transferase